MDHCLGYPSTPATPTSRGPKPPRKQPSPAPGRVPTSRAAPFAGAGRSGLPGPPQRRVGAPCEDGAPPPSHPKPTREGLKRHPSKYAPAHTISTTRWQPPLLVGGARTPTPAAPRPRLQGAGLRESPARLGAGEGVARPGGGTRGPRVSKVVAAKALPSRASHRQQVLPARGSLGGGCAHTAPAGTVALAGSPFRGPLRAVQGSARPNRSRAPALAPPRPLSGLPQSSPGGRLGTRNLSARPARARPPPLPRASPPPSPQDTRPHAHQRGEARPPSCDVQPTPDSPHPGGRRRARAGRAGGAAARGTGSRPPPGVRDARGQGRPPPPAARPRPRASPPALTITLPCILAVLIIAFSFILPPG